MTATFPFCAVHCRHLLGGGVRGSGTQAGGLPGSVYVMGGRARVPSAPRHKWVPVRNVDKFVKDVYKYWHGHGFAALVSQVWVALRAEKEGRRGEG